MRTPLALFRCVAKAALNYVGFGIAGDLAVEVLPSVARDVWEWWGKGRPVAELRDEVQAVAELPDDEARRLATQAVAEASAEHPVSAQQQEQARVWLAQMPAVVRASQRRPADPSGRTVAASFPLEKPADLVPLLPARLPRFNKGDRPPALGGDWELEELLGVGGFGEVWKAVHPSLPPWAVKFCLDTSAKRSLQNEAALLGRVIKEGKHPGIVPLINASLSHDPPFLVYEYVSGGELTTLIRDWHAKPPADFVVRAARLVHQLAGIVAFAHRLSPPIVHRDLKPANILLAPVPPNGTSLRIADFGIGGVAAEKGAGHTLATVLSGAHTPLYASPQQKKGERPDPRDDVHALGVIWLHLLTGDLGLEPGHWREELEGRDIPQPLLELLGSCLSRRPEKRPADAAELEARLGGIVNTKAQPPAPPLVLRAPPSPQPLLPMPPAAPAKRTPSVAKALQALSGAPAAHAKAKEFAQKHDYASAVKALETLPRDLRDASLYSALIAQRDEVSRLEAAIDRAVEDGRFNSLRLLIESLLKLTPGRDDLRQLLEALPPLSTMSSLSGEIVNSIGMKFVRVPPGVFVMGSPPKDFVTGSAPYEAARKEYGYQHTVEITREFYMGVHLVTQMQWMGVMGRNPSDFSTTGRGQGKVLGVDTSDFPVEKCLGKTRRPF